MGTNYYAIKRVSTEMEENLINLAKEKKWDDLRQELKIFDFEIGGTDGVFGCVWRPDEDWNRIEVDFKYVHQLQNLFFALTGEELKLS